ncbi:hypothetical protein P3T36_006731 [Kitasatospora sp. MAP12-15]|nr:class III lanthipeptide [Kitasatospora sp. MAP12-44]MDH6115321.1 hypothetical protein [Kitasatospora sp. MAP12-44]
MSVLNLQNLKPRVSQSMGTPISVTSSSSDCCKVKDPGGRE